MKRWEENEGERREMSLSRGPKLWRDSLQETFFRGLCHIEPLSETYIDEGSRVTKVHGSLLRLVLVLGVRPILS